MHIRLQLAVVVRHGLRDDFLARSEQPNPQTSFYIYTTKYTYDMCIYTYVICIYVIISYKFNNLLTFYRFDSIQSALRSTSAGTAYSGDAARQRAILAWCVSSSHNTPKYDPLHPISFPQYLKLNARSRSSQTTLGWVEDNKSASHHYIHHLSKQRCFVPSSCPKLSYFNAEYRIWSEMRLGIEQQAQWSPGFSVRSYP